MNASTQQFIAPVSAKLADVIEQAAVQRDPDEGLPSGLPVKVHVALLAVTAILAMAIAILF